MRFAYPQLSRIPAGGVKWPYKSLKKTMHTPGGVGGRASPVSSKGFPSVRCSLHSAKQIFCVLQFSAKVA